MFSLAMQFLEGWIVFAEYARPRINAIASQKHTEDQEPSHSKPEEKKKTQEEKSEMKETAGKKKKKKMIAMVVADQPTDKDKEKK